ncbi:MAG: hypothetical protein EPO37_01000 [Nitrosarchaeum sp.]|nr:MAG: hypothetical protein EPO37_01000 [Nitrosarchaeum sp.]
MNLKKASYSMRYIVFLILIGFTGIAFATHDPTQPYIHSIILPFDMQEKTFEEFMEWCKPYYEERCTELYEKNLVSNVLSPLKQIKSGVALVDVQCKDGNVPAVRYDKMRVACVSLDTESKLVLRGWAVSKEGHAFTDSVKQEILIKLRKGPQSVNGTAQEFLVSEALADNRVWDLLKDTDYQVNCCTYTLDGNEFPYPLYVGITFQINERDMLVTTTYDLQQEKITNIETKQGIRTGGVISFEQKQEPFLADKYGKVTLDGKDALDICSALRLPCPTNPVSYGKLLDENNVLVKISGTSNFDVKLNQTHVCVTSKIETTCEMRK